MFRAIEDTPTERLISELRDRNHQLAETLREMSAELAKGDDADLRWLASNSYVLRRAADIVDGVYRA